MDPDIMTTLSDINSKKKHCLYILAMDSIIVAATAKADLDKYLNSKDSLISPQTDMDDVFLIYGFVMDIEELPFEISRKMAEDRFLWLFKFDGEDITGDPYESMEEITDVIEHSIAVDDSLDLEDFVVILGEEIEMSLSVSSSGKYMNAHEIYG